MRKFAIVGGGIGGLTLAIAMQRKGFHVTVYESAPSFKPLGAGIGLAANAIMAFANIGIDKEVISAGKQMKSVFIKDEAGSVITFTDAEALTKRFGIVNNFTIHRADLHNVLYSLVNVGSIVTGRTCVGIDQTLPVVRLKFSDGSSAEADFVIACDGIHSPIRRSLIPESTPRYAGYTCWRGVVHELPAGFNSDETVEVWGHGRRFGIVPLANGRVYWFATLNAKQNDPVMRSAGIPQLMDYFKNFPFPVQQLLERTPPDKVIWSDIIDIKPIERFAFGRILLIGDAAHATTPNMGQGACMAIEDAATLANGLTRYSPEEAFHRFEKHRIGRTTEIVSRSRTIGKIGQLQNPLLRLFRDSVFRRLPKRAFDAQFEAIYNVSFEY